MKISIKSKKVLVGIYILIVIGLLLFLILPFVFSSPNLIVDFQDRNIFGPIYSGLCLFASLVVLAIFIFKFKKKNLWAFLSFISIPVALTGYLGLSLSNDISKALMCNCISYFGNALLLPFLIMTVLDICKIKPHKAFTGIMFSVAAIMLVFSVTPGYLDILYKNPTFAIVNGFPKINKEYGPMHTAYIVYIVVYAVIFVGLAIYALIHKKISSKKYSVLLICIVAVNVLLWLLERLLPYSVEYLSASYVVTEIILLFIYNYLLKNGVFDLCNLTFTFEDDNNVNKKYTMTIDNVDLETVSTNSCESLYFLDTHNLIELIDQMFADNDLTNREKEVVSLMLKGFRRKEIAAKLFVSEETIKTHMKHIFQKLNISSKNELKHKASVFITESKNH